MDCGVLNLEDLRHVGQTQTIGRRVELLDAVGSTNDEALARTTDPASHGLVVFAEHQTSGRGRLNRSWHAPKGASILCTTLLFLEPDAFTAQSALLWSALAARQAIQQAADISPLIKWPNDLLIRNKKVCGILIESKPCHGRQRAFAIGIGINCLQHARHFPPEISDSATSLDLESVQPISRLEVARALLRALDYWYVQAGRTTPEQLAQDWLAHALPPGTRVTLRCEGKQYTGSLITIDPLAGIIVQLDEGGRRLFGPANTTLELMH